MKLAVMPDAAIVRHEEILSADFCISSPQSLARPGTITDAIPSQPTRKPFGAKLKDVFAVCLSRASHLPAAFCVEHQSATCSYHRLFTVIYHSDECRYEKL